MTPTPEDFLGRHPDADHDYLPRVRTAVADGECEVREPLSLSLGEGFIGIYEQRARNLVRWRSAHARRLQRDTAALVEAARAELGVETWWWDFSLAAGRSVIFVERKTDAAILGALFTVSKLEVSEEEWERLWGR